MLISNNSAAASTVADCLIIGGGAAGLTAAIYLARFRRSVTIVDSQDSRLALIPVTHNYPGFPLGIAGSHLLQNLRQQMQACGVDLTHGRVMALERRDDFFVADAGAGEIRARTVLLATGVVDAGLPFAGWKAAIQHGALRLCPICDGFDVRDRNIALVSAPENRIEHALFLRTFSKQVTLLTLSSEPPLRDNERRTLAEAGIRAIDTPMTAISESPDLRAVAHFGDGQALTFDVLYPMLGEHARSELALALGADATDCGALLVDSGQSTSVPGLYAAGDVVEGINQISIASAHAAIAATRIHNRLDRCLR